MNIAICEDNRTELADIRGYIERYCEANAYGGEIHAFETAEALLAAFEQGDFGIVFLDIYLPGQSGIEAARKIRERSPACALVFITSSPDHALEGFEVSATSYVVKPLSPEKMARALALCRREFEQNSRVLRAPMRGGVVNIALFGLRYVEVYDKSVLFHMEVGEVEARMTLDEVEEQLGGPPFLRCHRSYIVNMRFIEEIGERDFLLKGGDRVPIRRNGGRETRLALARFISGHREEA